MTRLEQFEMGVAAPLWSFESWRLQLCVGRSSECVLSSLLPLAVCAVVESVLDSCLMSLGQSSHCKCSFLVCTPWASAGYTELLQLVVCSASSMLPRLLQHLALEWLLL